MDVGRTDGVQGPGRIDGGKRVGKAPPPSSVPSTPPPADKVEISNAARFISEVNSLPPVRLGKIDEIRKLLESGEYETEERLEGAIEEFLKQNPDLAQ